MLRPANRLLLERAESTDLFVEGDQVLAELLEAVKLGHLLLRLAQGGGIGKGFRHGLAGHAASEAKLRIMCRVAVFGAVAGWLTAAPGYGANGTLSKSTKSRNSSRSLDLCVSKVARSLGMGSPLGIAANLYL
jgi:hypothetical protein